MNQEEDQGYGQLTNTEVYGALALILMELQKINKHFDKLMYSSEAINVKVNTNDTI